MVLFDYSRNVGSRVWATELTVTATSFIFLVLATPPVAAEFIPLSEPEGVIVTDLPPFGYVIRERQHTNTSVTLDFLSRRLRGYATSPSHGLVRCPFPRGV